MERQMRRRRREEEGGKGKRNWEGGETGFLV
jgi:hypothetical protein